MLRYLNMFVMIGIALILVSLAGFATGGKFLQEPGQEMNPTASLIYLGAGALMLFNGYLSIRNMPTLPTKPVQAASQAEADDADDDVESHENRRTPIRM